MKALKKSVSIVLSIIMVIGIFAIIPFAVSAETYTIGKENYTSGDYEYKLFSDGTAIITKYNGSDTEINIPSELDGKTVTCVGELVFASCKSLTSVTIPGSVKRLEDFAFCDCSNLTSVTINNGLEKIYAEVFKNCDSLTDIVIPENVTKIEGAAFSSCEKLKSITVDSNNKNYCSEDGVLYNKDKTELVQYPAGKTNTSFVIPSSVTLIDYYAFEDAVNLKSVTIPDSVTFISVYAFAGCKNLMSITIPKSVETLADFAFGYYNYRNDNDEPCVIEGVKISGYKGTVAEKYAKENNIAFVDLTPKNSSKTDSNTSKVSKKTVKNNTITVKAKTKTIKLKKLKKKAQTVKPLTVKKAKGKVTYKLIKKGTAKKIWKYLKISKKGAITVKKWKKAKKGTYKIKVRVTAAGNKSYRKGSKTVTAKIKVK